MKTPEVRDVEFFCGMNFIARITCAKPVDFHQEKYLKQLLTAHFRTNRVYSQPCLQVSGAEILFRPSQAPRFIAPDGEEMAQILSGMNLMPKPPSPPARKPLKPRLSQKKPIEARATA